MGCTGANAVACRIAVKLAADANVDHWGIGTGNRVGVRVGHCDAGAGCEGILGLNSKAVVGNDIGVLVHRSVRLVHVKRSTGQIHDRALGPTSLLQACGSSSVSEKVLSCWHVS